MQSVQALLAANANHACLHIANSTFPPSIIITSFAALANYLKRLKCLTRHQGNINLFFS